MDVLPQSLQVGGEYLSTISAFPTEARFSGVLEIPQEKGQDGENMQLCTATLHLAVQCCFLP